MKLLPAIALLLPALAFADQRSMDLNVSPARADFVAKPGQTAFQRFTFVNDGSRPVSIQLRTSDAWYDEKGSVLLPAAGTSPRGLGRWLTPPPDSLVVEPGTKAEVDAVVRIPSDAAAGSHFGAIVGVASVVEAGRTPQGTGRARTANANSRMEVQLALLVAVDVAWPDGSREPPALAVMDIAVDPPTPARPLEVRAMLENPSQTLVRPAGTLAVFDALGRPVGTAPFEQQAVWPGQRRWFSTSVALPLPPGEYRAIAAFDAPDAGAAFEEVGFSVASTPTSRPVQRRRAIDHGVR